MPREDSLSSRFDYLFEPLDVEEPDDGVHAAKGSPDDGEQSSTAAPVRLAFAAFVLATLGAVAVVAVLLLQQPNTPQSPLDLPVETSLRPTTVANVPSSAGTVPPPPPATAESQPPQTIESVPTQQVTPAPQQPPPPTPRRGPENSPTTRAPMSVAPESRPPFPNQGPRPGDGSRGLLGGLL